MHKNRIYGYNRDKFIVEIVEKFKCLDGEQLKLLIFLETCNEESAKRQCQNVTNRLVKKKKLLQRWRMDKDESYKYFIDDFAQKEHITLLNWMFIHYLIKHPFERTYHMEYQRDYGIKIPDLFLVTYNEWDKERPYKAIFFEMDNTITNKFDAVKKYNKLFESKPNDEFVKLTAPHFPKIIISTTDKKRLDEINRLIKKENKYYIVDNKRQECINYETHLIWDIKEECKNEKVSNIRDRFVNNVVIADTRHSLR